MSFHYFMTRSIYFALAILPYCFAGDPLIAYTSTSAANVEWTKYTKSVSVIPDKYTIHWHVDQQNQPASITILLQVNTTGWIGFGFSEPETGGMPGSDVVTASVTKNDTYFTTIMTDRYATKKALPPPDDCQNYVPNFGFQTADGQTLVEFTRPLNTSDSQDRVVTNGSVSIVYAYGENGMTDISYHGDNRGYTEVVFFGDEDSSPVDSTPEVQVFNYTAPPFKLSAEPTLYSCTGFIFDPLANSTDTSGHIISVAPIIGSKYVHHMLVYICSNDNFFQKVLNNPTVCASSNSNDHTEGMSGCYGFVYGWAVGTGVLNYPAEAGLPFGDSSDPYTTKYVVIQTHYNNPTGADPNMTDETGVSIHYTSKKRQYDAGWVVLGDPLVVSPPMAIGKTEPTEFQYTCPGECTNIWPHEARVFASMPHMHSYGTQIWSTVTSSNTSDKGVNPRVIGNVGGNQSVVMDLSEFWEFDFQKIHKINDFWIRPGDRINTHCVYDTSVNKFPSLAPNATEVEFGIASYNEMWTYSDPNIPFMFCGVADRNQTSTICGIGANDILPIANPPTLSYLQDPKGVETRQFGQPPNTCAASRI
ncbi:hypothetical protein K493DRAFT_295365 [Basidiobolus meristosporus CBS 931.73]|uniref:DOMON domain-containing protein n=1 Tax=Basidiobolus meristosporus CBS 931.73 TaxID=1314790 RepID=A0A1Y1ZBV1_9FUNG|nr:hypothetical protein K493DRAFT_295365 [Basidiobolus meristosporus CBS 931.73]|eukprot:ORY07730.1 hypothetical protein K493DRAFT_295365 [Basidiobolus meristosporus CBS 931.73]